MKKHLKYVIVACVLLSVVATGVYVWLSNDSASQSTEQTNQELEEKLARACEVFTEEKAKELFGETAMQSNQTTSATESFSGDIAASACVYNDRQYEPSEPAESQKLASITVRSPRSESGRNANEAVFVTNSLPAGSVKVAGYGETAFWNPEYGQLNVLKNGEWYILDYGMLLPSSRSQGETEKFAQIIFN